MQGRLSPPLHGRIQCFPEKNWESEFELAHSIGFKLMEWTLDRLTWSNNPIISAEGRKLIRQKCHDFQITIASLTGDNFMEGPFYKTKGEQRDEYLRELDLVLHACAELKIAKIVFPLVDNGRTESLEQERDLHCELLKRKDFLQTHRLQILFESEKDPQSLKEFISNYPSPYFGINYDIGNSASLGFKTDEEISGYGDRIYNVHIKDRLLGGTTVALGTGNADIPKSLRLLNSLGYSGNYILQTARGKEGDEVKLASHYQNQVFHWLKHQEELVWNLDSKENAHW